MLYAGRGTGKTFVSVGMSHAVVTGLPFLRWKAPKPRRVLHIDGEMAAVELRSRFHQEMLSSQVKIGPAMLKVLTADLITNGFASASAACQS
jgi:RecA-family ATPase